MPKEHNVICIVCPLACKVKLTLSGENEIIEVTNYTCKRGEEYALGEFISPVRVLTTTVITEGGASIPLLPVRTNKPIPKDMLKMSMHYLSRIRVRPPVKIGQVIASNILDIGADVIATEEVNC